MIKLDSPVLRYLVPCGYIYRWAVQLRNFCFDRHWLKSKSYPIPIICVGNITVGGTGKTPHVEFILRLLEGKYKVAVLTRGYGRKTRGLIIATHTSTARDIGDEPRQLKRKYPNVIIAVDGNRVRAMDYLMQLPNDERPQVVVMDDGFQHRYLRPSYNIVLVDANRPLRDERLLPVGRLREPISALDRAECVIATKCAPDMTPIEQRIIKRHLNLYPHQRIYFSRIKYHTPLPLSTLLCRSTSNNTSEIPKCCSPILLICGIANPDPLVQYLEQRYRVVEQLIYPDHYTFTAADVTHWQERYSILTQDYSSTPYIICTEKDAVRLSSLSDLLAQELLPHFYYQPIGVEIVDKEKDFVHLIELLAKGLRPKGLLHNRYE